LTAEKRLAYNKIPASRLVTHAHFAAISSTPLNFVVYQSGHTVHENKAEKNKSCNNN